MTTTPAHTVDPQLRDIVEEVFAPVRAPRGTFAHKVQLARSIVAYGGLIMTLVQLVVWLAIGVFTVHLDSPWWLWSTAPAAAAVWVLTRIDRSTDR